MTSRMARNLVIGCDGTNNQFGTENTNVVRLIQVLDRDPAKQRVYYDPGVGTMPEPGFVTPVGKWVSKVFGLAFGAGLAGKIGAAYKFLMDHYEPGDRIFLYGFSRGAYTVRALAGALHQFGLLPAGSDNLIPYVLRYSKAIQQLDGASQIAVCLLEVRLGNAPAIGVLRQPEALATLLATRQLLPGSRQVAVLEVELAHPHVHVGGAAQHRAVAGCRKLQPGRVDVHGVPKATLVNADVGQRDGARDDVGDVALLSQLHDALGVAGKCIVEMTVAPGRQSKKRRSATASEVVVVGGDVQGPPGVRHGADLVATHPGRSRTPHRNRAG